MDAQGLSVFHVTPCSSSQQSCWEAVELFVRFKQESLSNSFVGTKLSIQPSKFCFVSSKRLGSTVATVSFSRVEGAASDKKPKFSARAIKSLAMVELEARKLKYLNTGTEALLMGILVEGTSLAGKFLRENGITLFKVREETVNLLGMADSFSFSPEHPPLTKPARRALDLAVDEKMKSDESGEFTVSHLLLGIWSQKESAGHRIMATLGFDDGKANELAKTVSSVTKFLLSGEKAHVKSIAHPGFMCT